MSKIDTAWKSATSGEIYTPRLRMIYPTLLEPRAIQSDPNSKPKFSLTLAVPKALMGAPMKAITDGLTEALVAKFGKDWKTKKNLKFPLLKTEDQERLAEIADDYPLILRLSANVGYKPTIINPDTSFYDGDGSDIYSGRWAIAAGKFYAYENVSKGVSFGLNRVQLLDNADPIAGGRVATNEGFESYEGAGYGTEYSVGGPVGGRATTDDLVGASPSFAKELNDEIPF